jgi:5-(carboxyamino)imidazole ribonucleotide synthase
MSYDGLGNRECKNHHELHTYAVELGLPLLAEEKLDIKTEFAVGLVSNGTTSIELPLTETFFKNHICHYVIGPYQIEKNFELILKNEIDKLLKAKLKGLFAFEFFITNDNQIIINEGAARPHNSQHLTMNLCDQSQFDYIVNLALDSANLKPFHLNAPLGAMINLLGKKESIDPQLHLKPISSEYKYSIYMYGKKIGRVGRKLGHLNILSNNLNKIEFTKTLDEIYEGYYL